MYWNQKNWQVVDNICQGCGRICGPVHKCDLCGSNMYPFCGIPIGEEGHGQTIRYWICDLEQLKEHHRLRQVVP